jgi:type I restriction enzyme S subunit
MELVVPNEWEKIPLSSIFSKRSEKVGQRNITAYSCTNTGIVPREDKFNKDLSASLAKNKVAYRGDFVFGMSREILNFGMMRQDVGCFSPAYKIYSVEDIRLSEYMEKFIRLNHDYYYQAVTGGAREGKGLSERNLFNLLMPIPTDEALDNIFNLIILFNEKIKTLKESISLTETISDSVITGLVKGNFDVPDVSRLE